MILVVWFFFSIKLQGNPAGLTVTVASGLLDKEISVSHVGNASCVYGFVYIPVNRKTMNS